MFNQILRRLRDPMTLGIVIAVIVIVGIIVFMTWNRSSSSNNSEEDYQQKNDDETEILATEEQSSDNQGGKPQLVMIWANWCGFSQDTKPEWDKAAKTLNDGGEIEAFDLEETRDSDIVESLQESLKDFQGYPHICLFPNGDFPNGENIVYGGDRSEDSFVKFAYTEGQQS